MLNKDNVRELAYVVKIDDVLPHPNADRLEIAVIGGWHVICGMGDFKKGDLGIYFEIDSKLPEKEPWTDMEFLASKHFRIKTQRIRGAISQGFVVPASALGWEIKDGHMCDKDDFIVDSKFIYNPETKETYSPDDETRFLTKQLEVTYAVVEDNKRKGAGSDKYKAMAQRNGKIARTGWWRWLYKRNWGKKLLFLFFGKKRDKKSDWPAWVERTDEERVENIPWILNAVDSDGEKLWWLPTEKIDGTSTSVTVKRGKFGKFDSYVCSRNVVFNTPEKMDRCYYDQNYYTQMAEKYNIIESLTNFLKDHLDCEWVTVQGETFGEGIQKRDYSLKEPEMRAFNFITSEKGRYPSNFGETELKEICDMKWVPIFEPMQLPDTIEELREYVHNKTSVIDGGMREGIVFRTLDGKRSFKCVDPEYLIKYHQ